MNCIVPKKKINKCVPQLRGKIFHDKIIIFLVKECTCFLYIAIKN